MCTYPEPGNSDVSEIRGSVKLAALARLVLGMGLTTENAATPVLREFTDRQGKGPRSHHLESQMTLGGSRACVGTMDPADLRHSAARERGVVLRNGGRKQGGEPGDRETVSPRSLLLLGVGRFQVSTCRGRLEMHPWEPGPQYFCTPCAHALLL